MLQTNEIMLDIDPKLQHNAITFGMDWELVMLVGYHTADQKASSATSPRAAPEGRKTWREGQSAREIPSSSGTHDRGGTSNAAVDVEYEDEAQSSPRLGTRRSFIACLSKNLTCTVKKRHRRSLVRPPAHSHY